MVHGPRAHYTMHGAPAYPSPLFSPRHHRSRDWISDWKHISGLQAVPVAPERARFPLSCMPEHSAPVMGTRLALREAGTL
eukprot:2651749-Pyramimonas_sp.AAC.1